MNLKNPHDKFFKETFSNVTVAKDFLTNYLPESVMKHINIATLEPQKDSFINKDLEESFSDLLFKADIAGHEGYLYLLFEHKSYPDKGIALQALRYMVEIWEAKMDKEANRLPIIIPLVIYHGKADWRIPSSLGNILNGYDQLPADLKVYIPNFDYLLYDVSVYTDEKIKGIAQTKIGLTLLRDIFTADTDKLLQSFYRSVHYLNELEDRQTGIEYFETMIRYLLSSAKQLTERDMDEMIRKIEKTFLEGSELAMTLADILREEGRKEGREEGRKERGTEILAETALQMLIERFGKVPQDIKEAIAKTDSAALKLLLVNSFKFDEIDEAWKYIQ
jgi:predicted transposase/invertase (TIGR01784 family)